MPYIRAIIYTAGLALLSFLCTVGLVIIERTFHVPSFHFLTVTVIGVLLLLCGVVLRVWSSFLFYRRNQGILTLKSPDVLITDGPYAFTRNPLYIGLLLMTIGVACIYGSVTTVFCSLAFAFWWHWYVVTFEEQHLKKRLGKQYVEYMKKIPRWL